MGALSVALSGCGASSALGSAVLAPLSALPQTDVVLETNLQSAVEAGQAQSGLQGISAISGAAQSGGLPETNGAPTTPGVVSVASALGRIGLHSLQPGRQALPRDLRPHRRIGPGAGRERTGHLRLLVRRGECFRLHRCGLHDRRRQSPPAGPREIPPREAGRAARASDPAPAGTAQRRPWAGKVPQLASST